MRAAATPRDLGAPVQVQKHGEQARAVGFVLVPATQDPAGPGPGDATWLPSFGACRPGLGLLPAGAMPALTVVEVSAQLVVGAAFHHLCDVLGLLVDGHGPDDGARGRRGGHLDLDGACLGDLTVEFLQQGGVLERKRELCLQSLGAGKGKHEHVVRAAGSLDVCCPSWEGCCVLGTRVPAGGLELGQPCPQRPSLPQPPAYTLRLFFSCWLLTERDWDFPAYEDAGSSPGVLGRRRGAASSQQSHFQREREEQQAFPGQRLPE